MQLNWERNTRAIFKCGELSNRDSGILSKKSRVVSSLESGIDAPKVLKFIIDVMNITNSDI